MTAAATAETETDPHALAHQYAAIGIKVIPIIPGEKHPPQNEWSTVATTDPETIDRWWEGKYSGYGVGLAMGPQPDGRNLFALDVDGDSGHDALEAWQTEHGDLPETWTAYSGGDAGTHLIFRAPADVDVRNQQGAGQRVAAGVDVRGAGGQIVTAPTVHPKTGSRYRWAEGSAPWERPLAAAPAALLDAVRPVATPAAPVAPSTPLNATNTTTAKTAGNRSAVSDPSADETPADWLRRGWDWDTRLAAAGWTEHHTKGDETFWVRPGKPVRDGHSAVYHHDTGAFVVWTTSMPELAKVGKLTADGSGYTLTPLDFVAGTEHGGDLSAASAAIRRIMPRVDRPRLAAPTMSGPPPGVDPETGEVMDGTDTLGRNLPPDFWAASETLEQIRTAAHSRVVSADAVLAAVLCRVAVMTPETLCLPPIVGARASLNFLAGVVGSSGTGKTTAVDLAADLMPGLEDRKHVIVNPAGSGEGLIDQYFEWVLEENATGKKERVKKQTKTAALVMLDEGQALKEMTSRSGTTTMTTLRSAWSGALLGQANASAETYRRLNAHTYRMAVLAGFQPEYAHDLIADAAGGTPQRFVFAHGVDQSIDPAAEWPGALDFTPAPRIPNQTVEVHADIWAGIKLRKLESQRGTLQVDNLDSHADLVRLKVATLLAILHGSTVVELDGWELAEQFMRSSNAVRAWVIEMHRAGERNREEAHTAAAVRREAAVAGDAEHRALESGAKSIGNRVHKLGRPCRRNDLKGATSNHMRKLASVDDMIAHAVASGWIIETSEAPQGANDSGERWAPGTSKPS